MMYFLHVIEHLCKISNCDAYHMYIPSKDEAKKKYKFLLEKRISKLKISKSSSHFPLKKIYKVRLSLKKEKKLLRKRRPPKHGPQNFIILKLLLPKKRENLVIKSMVNQEYYITVLNYKK